MLIKNRLLRIVLVCVLTFVMLAFVGCEGSSAPRDDQNDSGQAALDTQGTTSGETDESSDGTEAPDEAEPSGEPGTSEESSISTGNWQNPTDVELWVSLFEEITYTYSVDGAT